MNKLVNSLDKMQSLLQNSEKELKKMGFGVVREFHPMELTIKWTEGRIYGVVSNKPILECPASERIESLKALHEFMSACKDHAEYIATEIMDLCLEIEVNNETPR